MVLFFAKGATRRTEIVCRRRCPPPPRIRIRKESSSAKRLLLLLLSCKRRDVALDSEKIHEPSNYSTKETLFCLNTLVVLLYDSFELELDLGCAVH